MDNQHKLIAGYRDLTRLRYDFPLILLKDESGTPCVESLSGLIDGILDKIARGPDGDRIRKHVLRLEQHIRAQAAKLEVDQKKFQDMLAQLADGEAATTGASEQKSAKGIFKFGKK